MASVSIDNQNKDATQDIHRAAADWVLKIEDEPALLTSEAFERWLHEDPAHSAAFARVSNTWRAAGELSPPPELETSELTLPLLERVQRSASWRPRLWAPLGGGLAACAVLLLVMTGRPVSEPVWSSQFRTETAQIQTYELADGTTLVLDARSRASAQFDADFRTVELAEGRLFVDVERDEDKPFRVALGDVVFSALGTSYAVERLDDGWRLEVYEGRVRANGLGELIVLGEDEALSFSNGALSRSSVGQTLETQLPDWTSQRVVFDAVALETAVDAFQRYSDEGIVVQGDALKAFRVSGVFRLTEPEAFIQTVSQLTGADIITDGSTTILSDRS